MKGPDTQEILSLGWAGGAKGTTGLAKASPHQVREQNCQGGWPYLLKPSSLTCYPTKKNLLLEGKDRMSQDISGSVWPVTSVLRPLMAQVLLRDLDPAYNFHCIIWKTESPPCHPLIAITQELHRLGLFSSAFSSPGHW